MTNQNKTDIGLIGLAVMGENLALNMESKGWYVSVYNRTVPGVEEGVVDRFMNSRAKGKNIEGFTDIKAFVDSIATPRKIMMMVRAGSPVDELMEQLFPLLSPGDILIDGGNSNYEDTNRRVKLAESKGFLFVGSGVSGGEEGALNGASIMPGGSEKAWSEVKPILQSIAAKAPDGTPCCQWVGPAGSGHFVKMIHNGIEYGDMQLIAEAYQGDPTLFTRSDAVEASWKFFDPVLRYWKENPDAPLYGYPAGTWGPLESEAMMHEHGADWTNPCKNLTNTDQYCEL